MALQIGDRVGDYRVTGVLGHGGMGKVFRVRSLLTDREEAMKVVLPDLAGNPELADRFLREIKVHASLQHPNIASLHAALRIEDRLVMILELVEGVSLEQRLRDGPLDVAPAVDCTMQVLSALAFAHDRGVIHRDIKPANILISSGGDVKLTDFGIARSSGAARLTGVGLAVGTLAYMSPEQVRSAEVDARSDIYSLGLTVYEAVTGRRAVEGNSEHALMEAQLRVLPPEPSLLNPQVPSVVSAAIMRAMCKDPAGRFQTAVEFQAALQEFRRSPAPPMTSALPVPAAELAELEARLSRAMGPIAKRLVADAARRHQSLSEIRRAVAAQIDDPVQREKFLKTDPGPTGVIPAATPSPAVSFDPSVLDRLTQSLATYVGPIAKVLVSRAARSARTTEELQNAVAGEITSADDRRRFPASVQ